MFPSVNKRYPCNKLKGEKKFKKQNKKRYIRYAQPFSRF